MKLITIIGARPQFIKAAVVSREIRNHKNIEEIIVHTGQHYDENMSQVFFDTLEIPKPDYNLGIVEKSHGAQTGRMLEAIEDVLLKEKPDWVLVYGDTNSTLAGALAAAKLHIPLAHVEAGLRSFNKRMPEEINRVLTDHVSDILFTPTANADANLVREGIDKDKLHRVGDVMYEASLFYGEKADSMCNMVDELEIAPKDYILATVHRAENTDDTNRLHAIFSALCQISKQKQVILPLHPRTRGALERENLIEQVSNAIRLIDPVGFLPMVSLEKNAKVILTDSGGVQKEAYFHRVPCITLREETEWTELVEAGWNRLVNPVSSEEIIAETRKVLQSNTLPNYVDHLYGNGSVSKSILDVLSNQ